MSYVNGYMLAVKTARLDDYKAMSEKMRAFVAERGATQYVEATGDGLAWGEVTSFPRAVQAQDDETVVFAWVTYPDKATCDAVNQAMMDAEGLFDTQDLPFDGKRMVFGGFKPILEWAK